MRKDFAQWDYTDAVQALGARQNKGDKEALRYVVEKNNWGDHGEGWSGPQFRGGDPNVSSTLEAGIERDFTPTGTSAGAVRRHRRGVVGRESGWVCTLEEGAGATEEKRKEAYDLLLAWWNQEKGLKKFRQMVTYGAAVGRGAQRLYWPPGELRDGRMPRFDNFREAAKRIYLLTPKPDEAAVVTDTWTMRKAGVYTFEDEDGKPAVGMCFVNNKGETVFRTLKSGGSSLTQRASGLVQRAVDYVSGNGAGRDAEAPGLALNGNLTLFEIELEALITDAVRRQQMLEDKANSMLSHNMDEAGFRAEAYLNALPPGEVIWTEDPDNPGNMIEVFKKDAAGKFQKGPGAVNFIQGIPIYEKDRETGEWRKVTLTTPQRDVVDPVPVKSYTDTAAHAERNILRDTDQLHVLISGDAASSGESRKQARDDYTKSLEETKSEVDYVGSAVMETVLKLAAIFAGRPGYFDGITVSFNARIDAGPLSSEDRSTNIEEMKEGIKSVEDAMQYAGIADPDAMKKKIAEEAAEKAKTQPTTLPTQPPIEDKTREGLPA